MNAKQVAFVAAILAVQQDDQFISLDVGRFDDWVLCDDVYKYRKSIGDDKPLAIHEMRELNGGYITTQQTGRWNRFRNIVRVTKKGKKLVEEWEAKA